MKQNPKELIFDEEAREYLRKGIATVVEVVSVTLGPKGRYVGLDSKWETPKITNDGDTIANHLELKDPYTNIGARIAKEVAKRMKEKCGDGTTTTLLLLGRLVDLAIKHITAGASPIHLKRGMEKGIEAMIHWINNHCASIEKDEEIAKISASAASGDTEIGKWIAEAFKKVGKFGGILVEEAKGMDTYVEIKEGIQLDQGYISAYFCSKQNSFTCEMENPRILLTDKKISSIQEILPLLQEVASLGKELFIIAENIEGDALSTLILNRMRGTLSICAIKAPGFGENKKAMLEDLAVLTGGTFFSDEIGNPLKEAKLLQTGSCQKIVVTKDQTMIVGGKGKREIIQKRIQQIEGEIKQTTTSYEREKLEERKCKLSGGIAIIYVGDLSELALKEKMQRTKDSLRSTQAAVKEGVIVGGGIALLHGAKHVEKEMQLEGDEKIGLQIVVEACHSPFKQLIQNSGYDSSLFLEKAIHAKEPIGFNVETEKMENLLEAGIQDAATVLKHALRFACSGAGMILMSECLIREAKEEEG